MKDQPPVKLTDKLDEKDIQIIKLLASGHLTKEIPGETGLKHRTVIDRVHEMKKRFGFATQVQLVCEIIKSDPETFADVLAQ